ncbi:hypothetical protein KQX54_021789 [Cotesia glomerata]|uniref:Uncharacterized protein n=1 Tax=Cotesia glomerata TaxID=32391 RepID=A0AAV7J976_COTGL|nr:hypothetical protein KQX54_021789 [Cotesia glomerata]
MSLNAASASYPVGQQKISSYSLGPPFPGRVLCRIREYQQSRSWEVAVRRMARTKVIDAVRVRETNLNCESAGRFQTDELYGRITRSPHGSVHLRITVTFKYWKLLHWSITVSILIGYQLHFYKPIGH